MFWLGFIIGAVCMYAVIAMILERDGRERPLEDCYSINRRRFDVKYSFLAIALALGLAGCGNTAVDNELVGQAKKLAQATPLVCMDFKRLDISLGVIRAGTGSMSSQDLWVVVTNEADLATIKKAVETGALVKVHYNTRRFAPCSDDNWMTSIEIVQ